jgi:hypothetical protein
MADRVVLDAHGILVFLGEEPGWAEVEEILRTGGPEFRVAEELGVTAAGSGTANSAVRRVAHLA